MRSRKHLGLALWACLAATPALAADPPTANHLPRYKITELRFPDSPDHGLVNDHPFPKTPFLNRICQPQGLSENDCATGWIVGADSKPHLFIYEQKKIVDLHKGEPVQSVDAVISNEGIVAAILTLKSQAGRSRARLVVYREGKLIDQTPQNSIPVSITPPDARGNFVLSTTGAAGGVDYHCSTKTPAQKKGRSDDFQGAGFVVGKGIHPQIKERGMGVYVEKNGAKFWFPQHGRTGRGLGSIGLKQEAGGFNDAGDFVFVLDRRAYFANAISRKSSEIPLPPNPPSPTFQQIWVDDKGTVAGNLGEKFERFGFLYRDGKSVLLSELVPQAAGLLFVSRRGLLVGATRNNHIFTHHEGKTHDLGHVEGTISHVTMNAAGQILVSTLGHVDGERTWFGTLQGQLTELHQLTPPDAEYTLRSARLINEKGTIAAIGMSRSKTDGQALYRAFVLEPEQPNATQPAPTTTTK